MVRSRNYIAVPPGATIREQLGDRGMSQKEFAARMDMSEKHISKLINGEVQLTVETAVRLETVLGVPAAFWNRLEAMYREDLIKTEAENSMDADVEIARRIPYSDMAKLGWVPATREPKEKVVNLRQYFEVVRLALLGNEQITRIACRRLVITEKSDLAVMAWAQEAKIKARDVRTAPVNVQGMINIIPELRKMTVMGKEACPVLSEHLAECGIALVMLPRLRGSSVDGVTFADGNRIVVSITNDVQYTDRMWNILFHELAHIALGHVGRSGGTSDDEEAAADRWSADSLITAEVFEQFKRDGDYDERNVIRLARELGIASGIVVGRMQREGMIKAGVMNELRDLCYNPIKRQDLTHATSDHP